MLRALFLVVVAWAAYEGLPLLFPPAVSPALPGQVAIITGSSSGIGAEMAVQMGRAGYRVVLAARRKAELDRVAASVLEAGGPGVLPIAADLGSAEDCERVVSSALREYGRIDYLVVNHAMFDDGMFLGKDVAAIDAMKVQFSVNVMGPAYLIRAALPALEAAPGGGRVVEVSSGSTKIAVPFHPGYVTTKSALTALIKAIAAELTLIDSPVRFVTCVLGMIGTPEVLIHEGLRSMAYPVYDTAKEIIVAAQRGVREAYVPRWTGFGVTLSFFSHFLEGVFMSSAYTFKIPAYVAELERNRRRPGGVRDKAGGDL